MDISLDIFKKEKIKYDWKTMYVGLKLNLINYNDITNYAVEYLSMHPETSNQEIIQLAWGSIDSECESILEKILKESHINDLNLDTESWQFEVRKWRFVILTYLKIKHQDDFERLLNKIAEVYANFNYPKDMDSFINYLPPKEDFNPSQYSKEENIVRLINFFNDFLKRELQYLQSDNNI